MAYRRIDITLPQGNQTDFGEFFDGLEIVDLRIRQEGEDRRRCIEVLCRDDSTEPILEKLADRFGEDKDYYAEVIALAALLPRPEEKEEEEKKDKPEEDSDGEQEVTKSRSRNRISRDELLDDLLPGTHVSQVYMLMVLLSSVIAAIGLVRDNTAVVIGAMVIAPLLLPNMSLALGTTLGDITMILRSLGANLVGVVICLGFSFAVGYFVEFDPSVKEIALRTTTEYSDIALALAAGTAGALAVTSGVSANLIGVMVAVALLPPMVAFGLLLGGGQLALARDRRAAGGGQHRLPEPRGGRHVPDPRRSARAVLRHRSREESGGCGDPHLGPGGRRGGRGDLAGG